MAAKLPARDLLREALLVYEDSFWVKEAEAREKTLIKPNALRHDRVWKS